MPDPASDERLIADNRKARHEYHIFETYDAGIVLLGTEVKSIREGRVNLRDSYGRIDDGEVYLHNLHVSPYSHRGYVDHEPLRRRKLLLTKQEIRKLATVQLYFKRGLVKVRLGVAKGKKAYDKRETIKRREIDRETRAMVKERSR